jgi:hypothetical protein
LANDADVDGDKLSLELVSGPRNGSLVWSGDGTFSYRAQNGFSGVDSFRYRVFDDQGGESMADVQLRVGMPAGTTTSTGMTAAASSSPVPGWPTQADLRAALSANSGGTAGGSATTANSANRALGISTGLGSDSSSQLSGSRSITRTVRRR